MESGSLSGETFVSYQLDTCSYSVEFVEDDEIVLHHVPAVLIAFYRLVDEAWAGLGLLGHKPQQ